jgi:hypothetical protein
LRIIESTEAILKTQRQVGFVCAACSRSAFAQELHRMLSGSVAVIDEDEQVDIHRPEKGGDFKELAEYCDLQIRGMILGGNLTSEVKSGSLAAARVQENVREDVALSDRAIIITLVEQTIAAFKWVNRLDEMDIWAELKGKKDDKIELSLRDLRLAQIGYRRTKDDLEAEYGVALEPVAQSVIANKALGVIANKSAKNATDFDALLARLGDDIGLGGADLQALLDKSDSPQGFIESLARAALFDDELLADLLLLADLYGYDNAKRR